MARLLVVLLAGLTLVSTTQRRDPATEHRAVKKRQATRTSVIERVIFRRYASPVEGRDDPEPSPDPVCICPNGEVCVLGCVESCGYQTDKRSAVADPEPAHPGQLESRKRTKTYPPHRTFIPAIDFHGTLLGPAQAAQFFRSQGTRFQHPTNGSIDLRDEAWIDFSVRTRQLAERSFSVHHVIKRTTDLLTSSGVLVRFGGSFLVRYFARQLATNEAEGYKPHETVLRLTDGFGLRATDIIPTVQTLLEDRNLKEVTATYYILTREMMENVVDTMCPRLGPAMCHDE